MRVLDHITDHASDRARHHFGRDLTQAEWLEVLAAILCGRSVMRKRQPSGREVYYVPMGGLVMQVVWNPALATVVTVFPWESRV